MVIAMRDRLPSLSQWYQLYNELNLVLIIKSHVFIDREQNCYD